MRIPLKPLTIPSYLTEENHSKEKEDDPSQEAYILKRRKEEQRIFQELHMLSHPLRSNHQENEEKLRKLLGMREQSGMFIINELHIQKSSEQLENGVDCNPDIRYI